jgi:hypothetical protein
MWRLLRRLSALRKLSCPPMPAQPRPDAVVIRFSPVTAAAVLAKAKQSARRSDGNGKYTASVFADHARGGESRAAVIERLLDASELEGIAATRNPNYWRCSTAQELLDRQFTFQKDGYPDERPEHYSVILGENPQLEDVQRFLDAFIKERR